MTILEKHHSVFGYSLQDLTEISPMICTHRIPTDPSVSPSREPQRILNNTMREVVKKEVIKLLHVGIIYPVPHSEWVSPVQVVRKKGGMTVIMNEKNKLIPQRTVTGVDIWEHNKELIRKRTDIGEHFTRVVIQSIVFIFLPLGERVHLTNLVYYY